MASHDAPDAYHAHLRRLTPQQRLEIAAGLSDGARELAAAGIAERHPNADAAERNVRLVVRLYGRQVAKRFFGNIPDDAR